MIDTEKEKKKKATIVFQSRKANEILDRFMLNDLINFLDIIIDMDQILSSGVSN